MRTVNDLKVPICNFLMLLLCLGNAFSQNDQLRIKQYSIEDRLSQTTILDLLKDSSGFIWIGTQGGLNRFDGQQFRHFKPIAEDTTSISSTYINKLLEDKNGNIWIGTLDGLNIYNPQSEVFNKVSLSTMKNEIITSLEVQENGTIWVGTRKTGIHRLLPLGQNKFKKDNFLSTTTITSLFIDNQKQLWIGGFEGAVFIFDLNNNNFELKPLQLNIQGRVQAFYRAEKKLLIGTEVGFYIYDLTTKNVKRVNLNEQHQGLTKQVTEFLDAGSLGVWVGTDSGVFLFDWKNEKVLNKIEYRENDINGLSNNRVYSLLQLTENQLFVGTNSNLDLIDFNIPYFKNISKNKKGAHILNDNSISAIFNDEEYTWVGTSVGGINLITRDKTYYFKEDKFKPNSITGNEVREILKDTKNQRLWIATTRGLNMIDLNTFDPNLPIFKTFTHDPKNPNSISNDFLKGITLDTEYNVWGATYGQGIFRLQLSNDNKVSIIRFKNNKSDPNSLTNDFVENIFSDPDNTIWAGTQGGLSRLSFSDNSLSKPSFTNITVLESSRNSTAPSIILDITIDSKGNKWLASSTHGLNLYLGNNKFKTWTDQEMNLDGIIYSLQHDDNDNLWMGTTAGIIRFDPITEEFKTYGIEDGIQNKDFNMHAKFKDNTGAIYFGGGGGLTYFHPKDLETIDHPQPLYFSQLRVKDEVVKTHNASKPWLTSAISKTENLQFRHDEFPFYLDFSSIDYRLHKDVSFAYKLLPTDTKWNDLKDPEIQFLNLPAGSYTLLVNGFSRGEEWAQEPLQMNLEILPPWWATWWAYLIYAGLAVGFTYSFYRFQLSKKLALAETMRLKEVSQLKNSLYDNITHEFRTPLTVILGMTDSLESELQTKTNAPIKNAVEMIRRNGNNLLLLVNEMLDLSKLESGHMETNLVQIKVVPFIKYLGESFQSFAQEDDIHFTVYSEIDELMMDVDSQKLSTIISNLLSNAIKFTPPLGKIVLHIQNENDAKLVIKISDTGMGITKEELPHIFNRFYQADATIIRKREGTGIGLALTKELVNLLGGQISVQSTPNEGSVFKVELPITQNAPKPSGESIKLSQKSTSRIAVSELQERANPKDVELPLVLIIEDNKDVAYYLNQCLTGHYKTIHAINGLVGLEMAFEHIPDIIISDVMMPGKDGYEVCGMLKKDERTDHIPIVLLTAKVTAKDRVLGLTQGADAYLAKPFIKEELFARLEQLLFLRKKLIAKFQQGQVSKVLAKQPKNAESKFIAKTIGLIHEELDNAAFGVSELSFKLGLSESQVYRKLKAITGKSTAVFIRTIRLEDAKEQLQNTDKTISEIAYQSGFNDPSWFSRAFKEEFGVAPSTIK